MTCEDCGEIKKRDFMTPPSEFNQTPPHRKKERRLQRYDVQVSDWNVGLACLGSEVQPFPVSSPRNWSNCLSSSELFHPWLCLCQTFK